MSDAKVTIDKFVTFHNYGNGWDCNVWNDPTSCSGMGMRVYRLRVDVPQELLGETVKGEVIDDVTQETT
jgi:hypothetical protein